MITLEINYDNDLPAIGNKNSTIQKPFETDFLTVISNVKLRPSFVIWGGVQNLELSNVERPIFRIFKITNIKIANDELFNYFVY